MSSSNFHIWLSFHIWLQMSVQSGAVAFPGAHLFCEFRATIYRNAGTTAFIFRLGATHVVNPYVASFANDHIHDDIRSAEAGHSLPFGFSSRKCNSFPCHFHPSGDQNRFSTFENYEPIEIKLFK